MVGSSTAQWSFVPAAKLEAAAADWDSINQAGANLPIFDSRFFLLLLQHFGSHGKALVAVAKQAGAARCAALLEPGKLGAWQTYQPAQAPLGAWVRAPGADTPALLRGLLGSGGLGALPLAVGVSQLDPDFDARPAESRGVSTLDYIETARLSVAGSFEQYWAGRGKNLKQNIRKQHSRFEREGVVPKLTVLTTAETIGAGVDEYGRIESRGWKGSDGTALHPDNAQGRFYRALMQVYAARGEAIVYQYSYGDRVVASDICLARDGVLIILKTTYDEEHKSTSPAMLMHHDMLQPAFDRQQFRRIEFYGRVMEWHGRLTEEKRVLYHLNCFRYPLLARLLQLRRTQAASK